jgi:hypothetical protein
MGDHLRLLGQKLDEVKAKKQEHPGRPAKSRAPVATS